MEIMENHDEQIEQDVARNKILGAIERAIEEWADPPGQPLKKRVVEQMVRELERLQKLWGFDV